VQPESSIACFDRDGTTWIEQPVYSQLLFVRHRLSDLAPQHPEWSSKPIFNGLIRGDLSALANATDKDVQELGNATQIDMNVDQFAALVKNWIAMAKHPHYDKPYLQMVYQPMLEVIPLRTHSPTAGDVPRSNAATPYSAQLNLDLL